MFKVGSSLNESRPIWRQQLLHGSATPRLFLDADASILQTTYSFPLSLVLVTFDETICNKVPHHHVSCMYW